MPRLLATLSVYADRRMARILMLGIISGFPQVLIGSVLTLWLREYGISRTAIGLAGLIYAVYSFNFAWAPFIDRLQIPWLSDRLGHRRAWIFVLQALLLTCLLTWTLLDPVANLTAIVAIGLLMAIVSATQDITIDALRIEQLGESESRGMAAGAAMAAVGWWTGFKLGGAAALTTAEKFQLAGFENYWQMTFVVLGAIVIACNIGLMWVREPSGQARRTAQAHAQRRVEARLGSFGATGSVAAWLVGTVVNPLLSFFRRNGIGTALALLGFVFLFKIGEAFLGRMSLVFYQEIGFTKDDIALYSKGLGWLVTVAFTLAGSLLAVRAGIVRALVIAGIAMAGTNLLFALLAWTGRSELLFAVAVVLDDITSALATVTFVAFISMLVDRTYTATQYALLASIATAGRTTLAAGSGWVVDSLDGNWALFFVLTTVMVVPSLACLWWIRRILRRLVGDGKVRITGLAAG